MRSPAKVPSSTSASSLSSASISFRVPASEILLTDSLSLLPMSLTFSACPSNCARASLMPLMIWTSNCSAGVNCSAGFGIASPFVRSARIAQQVQVRLPAHVVVGEVLAVPGEQDAPDGLHTWNGRTHGFPSFPRAGPQVERVDLQWYLKRQSHQQRRLVYPAKGFLARH